MHYLFVWARIDELGMNMHMKYDWVVGCILS